jgi:hypothetical protein
MSPTPSSWPEISRRGFLTWVLAGWVVAATTWTEDAVAKTLKENKEVWIPSSFIDQINAYESSDSPITGNPEKYRALAIPLIEAGLDKPENLKKLRYLIYRELREWYKDAALPDFREYNAEEVWNDTAFFGGIKGKNGIEYHKGAHYDTRIEGKIKFDTPDEILSVVHQRIKSKEAGNIAFIMKDKNGIDIFVYYESGKLKYLFPTTPWSEKNPTPANLQVTSESKLANYFYDDAFKKYKTLKNGTKWGAMPYSRRLDYQTPRGAWKYAGHNTHVGNVTENGGSHGCARQSILGAYLMFYGLKTETLIYYRPELSLP